MLHLGLRRGEIAILPADAIKSDFDTVTGRDRFWLNIAERPYEDEDSRFNAPSLKMLISAVSCYLPKKSVVLSNYCHKIPHSFFVGITTQKGTLASFNPSSF